MANKFLPFIVEKSTPLHIYHTLLARSKGMNNALIATVLHVVLVVGITKVRTYVKTLPDLPLEKLYEEIADHYSPQRVSDYSLQLFLEVSSHIPRELIEDCFTPPELLELEIKDLIIFCLVLVLVERLTEHTTLKFDELFHNSLDVLDNIPQYLNFSDSGIPRQFKNAKDFRGFILYEVLINPNTNLDPIRAELKGD